MRELKWKLHEWNFNYGKYTGTPPAEQRFPIMDVHRGTLVKVVAVRVAEEFANITTLCIGDDGADDGFGDVTHGSTQLENLTGAYLCTQYSDGANANGKLYTEDDAIELVLTPSGAQSKGLLTVYVVYAEIE